MPWICVDAGIAAGKSTLLDALARDGVLVNKEPVGDPALGERLAWDPFLDDLYGGVKGAAFAFQKRVVLDRALSQESVSIGESPNCWGVMERSPDMQRLTFVKMGALSDAEIMHVNEMYDRSVWQPACIIYLRVQPEISPARMVARGRESEKGMSVDFHEKLHAMHEAAIECIRSKGIPVHIVEDSNPDAVRASVRWIFDHYVKNGQGI